MQHFLATAVDNAPAVVRPRRMVPAYSFRRPLSRLALFADIFPQDPQVGAPACRQVSGRFESMPSAPPPGFVLHGRFPGLDFTDRVNECRKLVRSRGAGLAAKFQAEHFPPARCGEALGMQLAKVIAVRFGIGRQRSEDGCGICVDVRQGSDGGLPAR